MADQQEMSARLERFLAKRLPHAKSIKVSDCVPLTGGWTCVMTRFTAAIDGETRQLVARVNVPAGQAVTINTDRMREWRLLSALTKLGTVPMPKALFADEDGSELGEQGMVVEFAEGGPFRAKLLSTGEEERPAQAKVLAGLAAGVHATDISKIPENVLERPHDWNAYIESLINEWREIDKELGYKIPALRYIAAWLDANRPPPTPLTLVHGEFRSTNYVFNRARQLLAIDWEFAHVGDPREDLGYCLMCEALDQLPLISRDIQAFCKHYRENSGLTEAVINPLTLTYFTVLPAIQQFKHVLRQQQAFVDGTNTTIQPAYLVGAVVTACDGWVKATQQIEASKR